MSAVAEILACVLLVCGTVFVTLAVAGTLRFRDLGMRTHAAAKSVVFGVVAILAASVGTEDPAMMRRAALAALLLVVTAPVSAHVIMNAAWKRRDEP